MGASVLIIDAEDEFASQCADALRAVGVEVNVTGDGKAGQDMAKSDLPAAIVLCVELPRQSGYSICNKLKKDSALKGVPVVLTSIAATPETFESHKRLKDHAEEYLKKPFPPALLVEVLKPYIGPYAAEGPAEVDGEEVAILDDVDVQPQAVLSDDEAFSAEEARSLEHDDATAVEMDGLPDLGEDQASFDDAFRALAEPAARNPRPHDVAEAITAAAGLRHRAAAAREGEDEAMTTVGQLGGPSGGHSNLEVEALKSQLKAAIESQTLAERERDNALASEKAARAQADALSASSAKPSSVPSGSASRELLEAKKERNAKEREIMTLKEQLSAKDRELMAWRDKETEFEDRIVRLEESLEATEGAKVTAESRVAATDVKIAELQKSSNSTISDLKRRLGEATAHEAELDASVANLSRDGEELRQRVMEQEELAGQSAQEIENLVAKVQQLEGNLGRTQNELSAVNAEAANLRNQIRQKSEEAEGLRGRLANVEQQLREKNEEAEGLTARVSELEQESQQLRADSDLLRAHLQQQEEDRAQQEAHLSQAYQKIRDDEAIRGKALKALEIALALLKEAGFVAPEAGDSPGETARS